MRGLAGRLAAGLRRTAPLRVWTTLSGAYLVAYLSVVNHRPLYVGDSRYYAALSLWLSGTSRADAYRTVREYTRLHHFDTPPESVLFNYGLTAPRLLYPLLSAPFVRLLGLKGLAVVPALSLVGIVVAMFITVAGRWGWRAALVPMILVVADWRITYYSVADITEGLTTFLSALILLVAFRRERLGTRGTVVWLIVLTTLMGFTRQATLIPAAAFGVAWLALTVRRGAARNRWALPALVTTATAAVVQVLQGILWPGFSQIGQLEKATHTTGTLRALLATPRLLAHIVKTDTMNLSAADLPLVLLVVAALASCVVLWAKEDTYLFLGALAASMVYNVSNGTPAGFRYEMPALPFFVLSVAALASWLGFSRAAHAAGSPDDGFRAEAPPPVSAGTPTPA